MVPPPRSSQFDKTIGYARDILVIVLIVGVGLYIMNNPEESTSS